jgi:hypothetical protein
MIPRQHSGGIRLEALPALEDTNYNIGEVIGAEMAQTISSA